MLVLSELPTDAGQHAQVSPGREIETRFRPLDEVRGSKCTMPRTCRRRYAIRSPVRAAGGGWCRWARRADRWGYGAR
ncbi:hypothetical protein [Streptomyces atratus]|uniref:hypothetical protein n=1 Tax=Streptomyces atratus TaxID=1893 RepID=UPI001E5116BF|nr:hypothetical protein [Streptomyces atratus]